jgi:hypothetical protein
MKVIMLSGKGDCGKSTTLNLVYYYICPLKRDIIDPKKCLGDFVNGDFECIIRYRNKTVAFYTMGDFSSKLCEAFTRYDGKCDVLICACNTDLYYPYQRINNYPHVKIDKTVNPNKRNSANEVDRDKILKAL